MSVDRTSAGVGQYAESIVQTVRQPIVVLDGVLRVRMANSAFYRTFAVAPDETVGRLLFSLGNGQWDIPGLRTLLQEMLVERRSFEDFEVQHSFERIGRRTMWLNARELPVPEGEERSILLVLEDVTERRRAEAARDRHLRELERSNRQLEEFTAVASHDLQEPLRKIRAYGDLLSTEYAERLEDAGRDYLGRMTSAGARMQTLIGDLLSLARVSATSRDFSPVRLGTVVRDVAIDLDHAVTQSGGAVHCDALPTIEADAVQMRQLFQNLLGNALKFRRPDVAPDVRVRARPAAITARSVTSWEIEVADNGIGFDQQYGELIFAPFQRLHGRGAYEGSGVGLAICRSIVERHGGTLAAAGVPGVGSTFLITLPARQPIPE